VSMLGDILEMFVSISETFVPIADGTNNNLWVTKSYDATSHFEEASDEILDIY
jgi:Rab GDP dissociation inhibitor